MADAQFKNKSSHLGEWLRRQFPVDVLVVFLLTLLSFSNIFRNQFVMDDYDFIVDWPLIRNFYNFPRFFIGYIPPEAQPGIYSPLKTLVHSILYQFFGPNPLGYHAVSLLIHLAGVWLVYKITQRLTQNKTVTFWTAVLFALHPVHVEAITYLTASVDTLGIVFLFAAFYFYMKTAENPKDFYPALVFGVLAVFTHELAISLPLLIIWYDFIYHRPKITDRSTWKRWGIFFLVVFVYVFSKWEVLGTLARGQYLFGHFYLTMMVMIKAWVKYVWISLYPLTLTPNHVISPGIFSFDEKDFDTYAVLSQSILQPQILGSLIVLMIIGWWAVKSLQRQPLITFCIGWFFISLLPGSNIIPSTVYFAERYLYPASLGFCLLISYSISLLGRAKWSFAGRAGLIVLAIFYAGRSFWRNFDWQDQTTIYESSVKANPKSAFLRNDLGLVYLQSGQTPKALESFKKAIELKPEEPHFYFSIEGAYSELGQLNESLAHLKKAIELNPEFAEGYYNAAGLYAYLGDQQQARSFMQEAVRHYRRQGRVLEASEAIVSLEGYLEASQALLKESQKTVPAPKN